MAGLAQRLEAVARDRQTMVDRWRARLSDPRENATGTASNTLAGHLRLLAIAAYALDRDVRRFRLLLGESASLVASLYDRFDSGEPIDESYVSWMGYKALFDALACGDGALATRLAAKLGGRPQIERKHDAPFTRAIASALKHVVLGAGPDVLPAVAAFAEVCRGKGNAAFAGYAAGLQAIVDADAGAVEAAVAVVLAAHPGLCSRGRMFDLTPDEVICTWALGVVNLAVSRGMPVRVDHPLVPVALVAAEPNAAPDRGGM